MSLPAPYWTSPDGRHVIYCADCLTVLPHIERGLTVTDPPYNIGYHYEGYKDALPVEEYQDKIREACPLPCVLIHYAEDLVAISWTLEEVPEKIVAWVYASNTPRQWRGIAWWGCEPDFTKDGQPYKNPTDKRIAERIARGEAARLYDWWEVDQVKNVGSEKTEHPCQIPIAVMERILRITDAPIIIDPFMGSGTTGVACIRTGRRFIGIEIEPKYCAIAVERMERELAQPCLPTMEPERAKQEVLL